MKTLRFIIFLLPLLALTTHAQEETLAIYQVMDTTTPETRPVTVLYAQKPRVIYVQNNPALTTKDIASATLWGDIAPTMQINFNEEGKTKFANLTQETAKTANKNIAIFLNGQFASMIFIPNVSTTLESLAFSGMSWPLATAATDALNKNPRTSDTILYNNR